MEKEENWSLIISSKKSWKDNTLFSFYKYRELLWMFINRDVITTYKQTLLGPLWYILQPILMTLIFLIVFTKITASPLHHPIHAIFYYINVILWFFVADSINRTSNIFVLNQHLFSKVYFPRVIVSLSIILSLWIRLLIQFIIFVLIWIFVWKTGEIKPNPYYIPLFPIIVLILTILVLGIGMICSSISAKYRDLNLLITFCIQLWMYLTPIFYAASQVPEQYARLYWLNPLVSLMEAVRFIFLGTGNFDLFKILYSFLFSILACFIGFIIFSRTEKNFLDTV